MPATTDAARRSGVRLAGVALLAHLAVNLAHGVPHATIPVQLPAWLDAVVALTVVGLPVAGVALLWRGRGRLGAALFTLSVAAALLVGLALHFVVPGPDNVAAAPAGPWRLPFRATAVGIAVVDLLAVAAGAWTWRTLDADRADGDPTSTARADGGISSTARVNGVPAHEAGPAARLSYRLARRELGEVPAPLTLMAHHRGVLLGYGAMEYALDRAEAVDDRLTELAVLKSAMDIGCEFCVDIGAALGRDLGVTEAQLRNLHEFEDSDAFDREERLVLRYAAAMTETPTEVPEELVDELRAQFDEPQLVELTAAVAFENFRGRFNHALGVESQDFAEGAYCPAPEPVTDGDASDGTETADPGSPSP